MHIEHVLARGERRLAQCVAWCSRESLDLAWMDQLFRTYVLEGCAFGLEFCDTDSNAISSFDARLRRWGRRLLRWPAGAPGCAVLGELGWPDAEALLLRRSMSLLGRLRCLDRGAGCSVAAEVFRYASHLPGSWAAWAYAYARASGVVDPSHVGVGFPAGSVPRSRWMRHHVLPACEYGSARRFSQWASTFDSLTEYLLFQPRPRLCSLVHNARVPSEFAREWGLARCGHHPCSDGRSARHLGLAVDTPCRLCRSPGGTLHHLLAHCPATAALRSQWCWRACGCDPLHVDMPALVSHSWLFRPDDQWNTPSSVSAHVAYVGQACLLYRRQP